MKIHGFHYFGFLSPEGYGWYIEVFVAVLGQQVEAGPCRGEGPWGGRAPCPGRGEGGHTGTAWWTVDHTGRGMVCDYGSVQITSPHCRLCHLVHASLNDP